MPNMHPPTPVGKSRDNETELRARLLQLKSRHDSGAVPLPIFKIIREIEVEIGWLLHKQQEQAR
jgi:hypothetical protein